MSEAPSWLTEENISTATKVVNNPAAQKAAKNPAVQKAAKSAAQSQLNKEAPGWTSEDIHSDMEKGKAGSPPPPPPKSAPAAAAPKTPINTDMSDVDPETMKNMQRHHLALRVLYIGAAVFLSTAAALSLQSQNDLGLIFFAFYVLFFSAIICCFEVALTAIARLIAVNFGFMYTLWGRLTFIILLGFMSFLLSVLGKVAMGALYGVMLFQIYVMWKFPRFEEYLRKKHYFEGRQAEALAKK
mmetsp:Transcript_70948/g.139343  ORF Transcript_70948/g.139343 Transcript_70948/m.139343 type:complete len:242 (+) Transcript_70948:78-803(+)|eukprot:CAMPEP_0170358010 /NCGR_PEP_ID=MMETSP0117_2-20130122/2008_1 /TAXON_ID=400756 /ORGANISM="Durinskia baltica, Strain CSIRO CS-38" /LENGTH=241 /DNA_ID=CAMNT_0010612207 /DNA_START=78 /DNA_END=803 /DNA_ORIENTATION=-